MIPSIDDTLPPAIDADLVMECLTEFAILCRNESLYPRQHPGIVPHATTIVSLFDRIVADSGSIRIGIARDALLICDIPLERKNPVFRNVAKLLFSQGIAALTIFPEVGIEELLAFIHIVNCSPGVIEGRGGIVRAVADAGIKRIHVTDIDYGAFRLTEEETVATETVVTGERTVSLLWERFVRGVINDVLDPEGSLAVSFPRVTPEILAELVNQSQGESIEGRTLSYAQTIVQFFRKAARDGAGDEIDRVSKFINRLDPGLRRGFLVTTLEALKGDVALSGHLLSSLSNEALLDALVEMNSRGETVSPYLSALMKRLSTLGVSSELISAATEGGGDDQAGLVDKLKSILKNDQAELFLPVDYQALIRSIIDAEQVSSEEIEEREQLLSRMVGHPLELQVNAVILNLIEYPSGEDRPDQLKQHFADMLSYYLAIGDYAALLSVYERLNRNIEDPSLRQSLLDLFATADFIGEVLGSISTWGKSKFGDIKSLISRVGAPFLIPTLKRLAEEESMSLRRFYLERLREFGVSAVEPALALLRDERWYVVRNMLVLLRTLDACQAVKQVRRLLSNRHPRVRHEVLRTLIYFQDPEADRQLMLELKSEKQEVQLAAMQLAESSKNPQVLARLLELLKNSGDFELKFAALHSLSAIGNPVILPELEQLLKATSIMHPIQMSKLKLEITSCLERLSSQGAGRSSTMSRGGEGLSIDSRAEELPQERP